MERKKASSRRSVVLRIETRNSFVKHPSHPNQLLHEHTHIIVDLVNVAGLGSIIREDETDFSLFLFDTCSPSR